MIILLCFLLVGCLCDPLTPPPTTTLFNRISNGFNQMFNPESEYAYNRLAERQRMQPFIPDDTQFPCDTGNGRSPERPKDVDHVAPGDIDVVAAIGDSLTLAKGARAPNVLFVAGENRGLSWSIGGQNTWRKFLTLPNILRLYNPNLIGFSESSDDIQFNEAVSNAVSSDLPWLTRSAVHKILNDSRVNVQNDWKLVTIMIGSNDFCTRICYTGQKYRISHKSLDSIIRTALDYIRDSLPRTIVNVVLPPVLEMYKSLNSGFCRMMYSLQCPCITEGTRKNTEREIAEMQMLWLNVLEEAASDERYRKEDFAVIVQPFMKSVYVTSRAGQEFFSRSLFADDCIHFSQKGQATIANALWNNMLQPVGQKSETWTPLFDPIICPTEEHPYIFTYNNSPNETVVLHEARLDIINITREHSD